MCEENPGESAERLIEQLLNGVFSPYFVWRNPKVIRGSKERELTDVLALFNNTAYIFESKFKEKIVEANIEKHIIKAVKKANRQLKGASKFLKKGAEIKSGDGSLCIGDILDMSEIKLWHAIVVITCSEQNIIQKMSGMVTPDIQINYISIRDLKLITEILDTPKDFELYLSFREKYYSFRPSYNPIESDLLSFFILSQHYSKNPDEKFKKLFGMLEKSNIDCQDMNFIVPVFAESLSVDRKRDLDKLKKETKDFCHIDITIQNLISEQNLIFEMTDIFHFNNLKDDEKARAKNIRGKIGAFFSVS